MLVQAYQTLLNLDVDLLIVVGTKDLYDSLFTCRNSTDKSIRADVSLIRYEFETYKINRIVWIPGKCNPLMPSQNRTAPFVQLASPHYLWNPPHRF